MKSNTFFKLTFLTPLLFSGFLSNSAYANTITFEQPLFDTNTDTLSIDIDMSFADATAGGDFVFNFTNNGVANDGLSFLSYTSGGSGYDKFGNGEGGYNIGLVDTNDHIDTTPGISGDHKVGTLTFHVDKTGSYAFSALAPGFYTLGFKDTQNVDFTGSSISVDHISAVPEPSELLLMLSGLAIMSSAVKAKKSKNLV